MYDITLASNKLNSSCDIKISWPTLYPNPKSTIINAGSHISVVEKEGDLYLSPFSPEDPDVPELPLVPDVPDVPLELHIAWSILIKAISKVSLVLIPVHIKLPAS